MGTPNYRPDSPAERRRKLAEDTPEKRRHDAIVAKMDASYAQAREDAIRRNEERRHRDLTRAPSYSSVRIYRFHKGAHTDPYHHVGECTEACRAGLERHTHWERR